MEETHFGIHVGEAIYQTREEAEMKQDELSEMLGISSETLELIEQGGYEGEYLSFLRKTADLFDRNLDIHVRLVPRKFEAV